jgi:hypothetical protein
MNLSLINVVLVREIHCVERLKKIVAPSNVKMDGGEANGVKRVLKFNRLIVILASRFAKVKVELFVLQIF